MDIDEIERLVQALSPQDFRMLCLAVERREAWPLRTIHYGPESMKPWPTKEKTR